MKAIAIIGAKNRNGQTARALNALIDGMQSCGGTVERIFLPLLKIERCRQCEDSGWGKCIREGQCCIDDDFASVVEKAGKADAVIFANPVYYGDLSESLRAFLDRLRRTCIHEAGKKVVLGKRAIGIAVAGGGGGGYSCVRNMEEVLGTCGFNILDLIPARRQNLDNKCTVLKETGKWFASQ